MKRDPHFPMFLLALVIEALWPFIVLGILIDLPQSREFIVKTWLSP